MMVPGRAGYSVIGDESIEFVRTPQDYVERRRASYGDVFLGRVLNRPTVFLTSNKAVQDLLNVEWSNFGHGYDEYGMPQLFNESLVFIAGDAWQDMRSTLDQAFSHDCIAHSMEHITHVVQTHFSHLPSDEPVVVYEMLKELATQLSIALFLGHDIGEEEAKEVSELMTTHWRGIISVPFSMRGPWSMWKSGFSKALAAKDRLLDIITERLSSNPSKIASTLHESDKDSSAGHLLLFISALIPKALSSILTSTVIELSKPEHVRWRQGSQESDNILGDVLLEVQRLWPPFFGGRRICNQSCEIGGYSIPEGHAVAYISRAANRDEAVFSDPDHFNPGRWSNQNANDKDKVWTFGGGPRECIGKHLSTLLLKECMKELLANYVWEMEPGQDLTYKSLPIARPKADIKATFRRVSVSS